MPSTRPDSEPTPGAPTARTTADSGGGSGVGPAVILILIALIAGFLGTRAYYDVRQYDPNAAPTCGDEVMTIRDRCWYSGHGNGTYDDEVQAAADKHVQDKWIRNIGLPATGMLLILSILLIRRAFRAAAEKPTPMPGPAGPENDKSQGR